MLIALTVPLTGYVAVAPARASTTISPPAGAAPTRSGGRGRRGTARLQPRRSHGGDRGARGKARLWRSPGENLTGELVRTFEGQEGRRRCARLERGAACWCRSPTGIGWRAGRRPPGKRFTVRAEDRPALGRGSPGGEPGGGDVVGGQVGLWNAENGAAVKSFEPARRARARAGVPPRRQEAGGRQRQGHGSGVGRGERRAGAHARGGRGRCARWRRAPPTWRPALASGRGEAVGARGGGGPARARGEQGGSRRSPSAPRATSWPPAARTGSCGCGTWRPASCCARRSGHAGACARVAFNPNGQKMATGGADRTACAPGPCRCRRCPAADLEKITAALPAKATAAPKKPRKLLVFWRADAILHKGGVPAGQQGHRAAGQEDRRLRGRTSAATTRRFDPQGAGPLRRHRPQQHRPHRAARRGAREGAARLRARRRRRGRHPRRHRHVQGLARRAPRSWAPPSAATPGTPAAPGR